MLNIVKSAIIYQNNKGRQHATANSKNGPEMPFFKCWNEFFKCLVIHLTHQKEAENECDEKIIQNGSQLTKAVTDRDNAIDPRLISSWIDITISQNKATIDG